MPYDTPRAKRPSKTIQEIAEEIISDKKPRTVSELHSLLQRQKANITREDLVEIVKKLKDEGTITLEMAPPKAQTFSQYLTLRDWNTWLGLVLLLCTVTLAAIYLLPQTYPLITVRWITGSIFVLFLPGYVTVQALFPSSRDLDDIERFALSIGLSLAITPLIGLLLNYLPWGIRLDPIVTSLTLYTMGIGLAGSWRRYRTLSQNRKTQTEDRHPSS